MSAQPPPYQYPPPQGPGQFQGSTGLPQPDERNWAVAAHLGSLVAAYIALGFLGPLLVLLLKGGESAFVRSHAVESLNFQISMLIYASVATVVAFVAALLTLGLALFPIIPLALVLAVVYLVLVIVASVRASSGEHYRYPLTLRLVR
jgi:uncharacterized Tic20 family protein